MGRILELKQLRQLISAVFFETVREPGVLFWGIVFPILISLGLGLAFSGPAEMTRRIAIVSSPADNAGATQRSFLTDFLEKNAVAEARKNQANPVFRITVPDEKLGRTVFLFERSGWESAVVMMKRGKVSLIIEDNGGPPVYHFDPMNSDAQLTYLRLSEIFSGKGQAGAAGREEIQKLNISGARYIDFLIPGLIAMGIMMSCLWGISYSIIEKRSKKLLRRLVATPMKRSHFLIALITVRAAMNFIEGSLLFLVAMLVFNFQLQGSVFALLLIFISGNMAFAGIALLISSRTSNTETGNGLINAVHLPMVVLSGIFFSYHNFPEWAVPFIQKLPLTIMADDMRSVFTEGAGLAGIALNSGILALLGVVTFTLGLKAFKWH